MPIVEVQRVQHPVGQGGFHSCKIISGSARFAYVYDCGSSNASPRVRAVRKFAQEQGALSLDLLALSHLDSDHVNGVEQLLASRDVDLVFLPYLHVDVRLALLAEAAAEAELTKDYLDFITDPVAWLHARGAKRVVFVLPPEGEVGATLAEGEPPTGPVRGRFDEFDWKPISRDSALLKRYALLVSEESLVWPSGAPLSLRESGTAYWELVFFTHPLAHEILADFHIAVLKLLGLRRLRGVSGMKRLRDVLIDKGARARLASAYARAADVRNQTSMSLYSGPAFALRRDDLEIVYLSSVASRANEHWRCRRVLPSEIHRPPGVSWMGTGDYPLGTAAFVRSWTSHYASRLDRVLTFVLPHHGSSLSFTLDGAVTLQPRIWVAPAGINHYGHPNPALRRQLSALGFGFAHVSGKESTALHEFVRISRV